MIPILLAAGRSTRFEGGHKLLAPLTVDGRSMPVVAHAAAALRDAFDARPLVVLGARADEMRAALGPSHRFVANDAHADGMGTSLAAAARAIATDGAAGPVLIAMGDMPLVNAATILAVVAALGPQPDAVARAVTAGTPTPRPGHPVALASAWLRRMARLDGDEGLGSVLRGVPVVRVPVDPRTQIDVDTRAALARAAASG